MRNLLAALCLVPLLAWAQPSQAPVTELIQLAWQRGPSTGAVAENASITIPPGFVYLGEHDTRRFLELMGNPPSSGHYLVAPESLGWFAVLSFTPSGYVKDDETIDAAALLERLRRSEGPANEERKRLGLPALHAEGWQVDPHYDARTKRLEWGVRLRTESGSQVVNYTSRLLGRHGFTSAVLVSDPDKLAADTAAFNAVLEGFSYNAGQTYAEFRQGDKVAAYGLTALVLGGAATVATKKGFWAAAGAFLAASWKLLAGVAAVALAGAKSVFSRGKRA